MFDQPRELQHLIRMHQIPGWRGQAEHRVKQLERSGLWPEAKAALASELARIELEAEAKKHGE